MTKLLASIQAATDDSRFSKEIYKPTSDKSTVRVCSPCDSYRYAIGLEQIKKAESSSAYRFETETKKSDIITSIAHTVNQFLADLQIETFDENKFNIGYPNYYSNDYCNDYVETILKKKNIYDSDFLWIKFLDIAYSKDPRINYILPAFIASSNDAASDTFTQIINDKNADGKMKSKEEFKIELCKKKNNKRNGPYFYCTCSILLYALQHDANFNDYVFSFDQTILIFPLAYKIDGRLYKTSKTSVETLAGDYLIQHGVPIFDFYSHRY
jgi:hypothetical protein